MSLQLDSRQRAMLQEMGITLWQPAPAMPAATPATQSRSAPQPLARPAEVQTPVMERPTPQVATSPATSPPAMQARQRPAPVVTPPAATPITSPAPSSSPSAAALLRPAQALYPNADAAATPKELGAGWLVVFETPTPDEPFGGDSGKLLDNMLRAMRLHLHPRTFACVLERSNAAGQEAHHPAIQAALADTLAQLRPSMVLVLGLGAARATLGNREPLGRLRAVQHQMADGTPAIVSYDPAYLLRAPDAKVSAWADLCRALAVVRKATPA